MCVHCTNLTRHDWFEQSQSGSTWQFIMLFTTFWGLNEEKSSITLKSQCSQSSTTHELTKFGVNQVPLGMGGTMEVTSWKRLEKEHQLGACMVHGRVQKCGTAQNGHVSGDMIIIHQFRGYPVSHTDPHRSTCFAIFIHEIRDFPWIFMTQITMFPRFSMTFSPPKSGGHLHDDVGSVLQEFGFKAILMHL